MDDTKFIKSSVLQESFEFGRNTVYNQDMPIEAYDQRIQEFMDSNETPNNENLRTAIENQIEDGFEFEQNFNLA